MTSTQANNTGTKKKRQICKCAECNVGLVIGEVASVQCDICYRWMCLSCNKLEESDLPAIEETADIEGLLWMCMKCLSATYDSRQTVVALKEKIAKLEEERNRWKSNCLEYQNAMSKQVFDLKVKETVVKELKKEVKEVKEECKEYKENLEVAREDLANNIRTVANLNSQVEDLKVINKTRLQGHVEEQLEGNIRSESQEMQRDIACEKEMPMGGIERKEEGPRDGNKEVVGEPHKKSKVENNNINRPKANQEGQYQQRRKNNKRSKEICWHYEKGTCWRGAWCKFAHVRRENSWGAGYCRNEAVGKCQWGDACQHIHRYSTRINENIGRMDGKRQRENWTWGVNKTLQRRECPYYSERKRCPYGGSVGGCRYRCYGSYAPESGYSNRTERKVIQRGDTGREQTTEYSGVGYSKEREEVVNKISFLEREIGNLKGVMAIMNGSQMSTYQERRQGNLTYDMERMVGRGY